MRRCVYSRPTALCCVNSTKVILMTCLLGKDIRASSAGEVQAQQFLNFCFREYFISGMGPWGMLLKNTGGMVGNCGFCHINFNHKRGEVTFW